MDVEKIKKDFPILERKVNGKRLVYLDNAATTQKPRQVIDAVVDYYSNYNANVHRGLHTLAEEATIAYDEVRKKVAKFINAKPEEIIFTKNSTEALNLIMYAYGMSNVSAGEKLVTTIMDHHSSFVPLQILAKRKNAKFEIMDVDKEGEIPEKEYEKLENAKIASVVHASNVTGTINDIASMSKIVHEGDGVFIADGSQSVPHMKIDVKKLDIDFLAFTGHKMLAPMGVGVLYGKKELLEKMQPFLYGGDMILEVHEKESKWAEIPAKFEAGTPNVEGVIGLGAAIDYLEKLGMDNVRKHDIAITRYCMDELGKIREVRILGPENPEKRTALVGFEMKGVHPHDIAQVLDSEGIAIRAGHHCAQPLHERAGVIATARASFYIYNSKEDVDALCNALEKAQKLFA
ncbi:cysteine desulfurase [Candidatus Micrarchaeota archaeon]|nr:cysteine desulfurase [Candidatus Micrarchaeota archaeon]